MIDPNSVDEPGRTIRNSLGMRRVEDHRILLAQSRPGG